VTVLLSVSALKCSHCILKIKKKSFFQQCLIFSILSSAATGQVLKQPAAEFIFHNENSQNDLVYVPLTTKQHTLVYGRTWTHMNEYNK